MIIEAKEYEIHDNGGSPFIVKVYPDSRVEVYENNFIPEYDDCLIAEEPFFDQTVEKVFIGKSPLNLKFFLVSLSFRIERIVSISLVLPITKS